MKHVPETHINDRVYVWPLADGGPETEDNVVVVCATGHRNVTDLLNHYRQQMGQLPYGIIRRYSVKEREIAKLGYDRMIRKMM